MYTGSGAEHSKLGDLLLFTGVAYDIFHWAKRARGIQNFYNPTYILGPYRVFLLRLNIPSNQ